MHNLLMPEKFKIHCLLAHGKKKAKIEYNYTAVSLSAEQSWKNGMQTQSAPFFPISSTLL
jgi:hypothetical protein